jgi:hypothetical protein
MDPVSYLENGSMSVETCMKDLAWASFAGGTIRSIFDLAFNGSPRSEMYRAQVVPSLFPHERRMMVENWSAEDREMYCGGEYVKGNV